MSNVNTNAEFENNINNVHDVGYRAILSNKKTFVELLKTFVKKDWANQVDESDLVRLDRSYVLQDFSEKESDIVYKLKIRDSEVIFYCLLELQSNTLFDINRYSEKELGRMSNLISTVFLLDQDIDALELVERLKTQLELLKKLTVQERAVFLNWVAKIITRDVPQKFAEEVTRLFEENEEVEAMVYNLEVALKREFSQREQKGADETRKDIAKKLLQMGMDVEKVARATSLSETDIESILSEISN